MRSLIVATALATGVFSPALAQDAYVVGITATLPGRRQHLCACCRCASHLFRPGQCRRWNQRQEGQPHCPGYSADLRRLPPTPEAADARPSFVARRQSVPDLCACRGRGQERGRAARVSPARSVRRMSTRRRAEVSSAPRLSPRPMTAAPRSPSSRNSKDPVENPLCRYGDSIVLTRHIEFATKPAPELGIDRSASRSFHRRPPTIPPFASNYKGCRSELGVFLGAMGDGTHVSRRCVVYLEGRLRGLGASRSRGRTPEPYQRQLFVVGANALFQENLPIQKTIAEAVQKAGGKYPPEQMTEGSITAMVIEAALKGAGSPATPGQIQASMQNLKVVSTARRSYGMDQGKSLPHQAVLPGLQIDDSKIALVKNWFAYDVK